MEELVNEHLKELNKRLGVIISLLLRTISENGPTLKIKEQVRILDDLGLRPRDISEILGRTPTHINKELTGIRKERTKNEKEK